MPDYDQLVALPTLGLIGAGASFTYFSLSEGNFDSGHICLVVRNLTLTKYLSRVSALHLTLLK